MMTWRQGRLVAGLIGRLTASSTVGVIKTFRRALMTLPWFDMPFCQDLVNNSLSERGLSSFSSAIER
jgi:hypothetical protein